MIAAVPLLAVLVFVAYDYIDLAQYYHSEKLVGLAKYASLSLSPKFFYLFSLCFNIRLRFK